MKKISLLLLCLSCVMFVHSQNDDEVEFQDIQVAFESFIFFRDAVAANDTSAIRQSANNLRVANTCDFNSMRCNDDSEESLNGHLVFNIAFADSLAAGKNVYGQADDINRSSTTRGQYTDGKVHAKTCFVKAGSTTRYTFPSRGYQELAVVAESGGLVTMRIHVTNRAGLDERHDDTSDVRKGRPQRRTSFNLPTDRTSTVELEIVNCGSNDCSFVVISN